MSRNAHSQELLASFFLNGAACSGAELSRLEPASRRLVATIAYCLLSCEAHIRHHKGSIHINLSAGDDTGWEVANWAELPRALQHTLLQVFFANALTPGRAMA